MVLLNQCGIDPIIVHGGGPQINSLLERLNIKSQFVNGIRVTDSETMQVVQMVLAGTINKDIVSDINAAGGLAIGLCGKDANLIRAKQVTKTYRDPDSNIEKILDLGFAGEPSQVNPAILSLLQGSDIIPVIAPVAMGDDGTAYNVNADTAAGSIAGAIEAERLLLLTDVEGVKDKTGKVLKHITIAQAKEMIADGTAYGGMIPKLETCIDALEKGVKGVVIIDGRMPHSVLVELFTEEGAGTLVTA
jgi:acetylglutamate kinase